MKPLPFLVVCLFTASLVAACASAPEATPAAPEDLAGAWTIESIQDTAVVDESPAYVEFGPDGSFSGNASCNRMHGSWSLQNGRLELSRLATTKMAGPPPLADQEARLLAALGRVERVERTAGLLVLRTAGGDELVRARRREAQAEATLSGTVRYRERSALTPGHRLTVELQDVSRADAPAEVLARTTREVSGQVPFAFELAYDPARLQARRRYSLRATLHDAAGALVWTTTTATPVLTGDAPSTDIELMLEYVH